MSLGCRIEFAALLFGLVQMLSGTACVGKVNRHDTIIMKNGDRLTGEAKKIGAGSALR
jgi:hypothetical protein